jgi:ADP-heptose:LPS heptosyltransferase
VTRLTNATVRIGFVRRAKHPSVCYTDPVAPPDNPFDEHQIETLLRLLKPLGIVQINNFALNLSLRVPEASRQFAADFLIQLPSPRIMTINLSSTVRLKFRTEDFIELISRILAATDLTVVLVGAPPDQPKAAELAAQMNSARVVSVATPGPLDLAAILEKSTCLFTPEGGAAHLAAAVGTPALVLWSEGPFNKWHSRGGNHAFVHAEQREKTVPVERVWQALQSFITKKKG